MTSFRDRIQKGLEGKYSGLENGFKVLNKIIYRIQRGIYLLVGGLSGAGKSKLVNFMLLNAIQDAVIKGVKCHVFYYSFEIGESVMKANFLSAHIFKKYGISVPPEVINGFGDNRLTTVQLKLVDSEIDYIEDLFSKIHFRFNPMHPTAIFMDMFKFAETVGKFTHLHFKNSKGEDDKTVNGYIPDDPEAYYIAVIDHIGLLGDEQGLQLKGLIDKMSAYFIWIRNICGWSPIVLQQFNQTLNSTDRQKFKGVDLSPQQNDFKDSGNPYQDCDIGMGIFNPWKLDMKESMGYSLSIFKSCFRMIKVIKNRIGYDNTSVGTLFDPKSENFIELPDPNEMTRELYEEYRAKVV